MKRILKRLFESGESLTPKCRFTSRKFPGGICGSLDIRKTVYSALYVTHGCIGTYLYIHVYKNTLSEDGSFKTTSRKNLNHVSLELNRALQVLLWALMKNEHSLKQFTVVLQTRNWFCGSMWNKMFQDFCRGILVLMISTKESCRKYNFSIWTKMDCRVPWAIFCDCWWPCGKIYEMSAVLPEKLVLVACPQKLHSQANRMHPTDTPEMEEQRLWGNESCSEHAETRHWPESAEGARAIEWESCIPLSSCSMQKNHQLHGTRNYKIAPAMASFWIPHMRWSEMPAESSLPPVA